ncbi:MAG: glycosyltransferase [Clostridium celatum]|nr:glycosyltransferase [Clostridium celatum]
MDKLLIVSWEQFGYHTDNYMYCKYLSKNYKIKLICYDEDLERIEPFENVEVIYVKKIAGNKLSRLKFIFTCFKEIKGSKFKCVFIRYFRGCSVLKRILKGPNYIVDIRTGSVDYREDIREAYNKKMAKEVKIFDTITIISQGLKEKLNLPKKSTYILPLGSDTIISEDKINTKYNYNNMKILYVGTFFNRNIEKTVEAFGEFYNRYKEKVEMSYTIAGYSNNENEVLKIKETIKNLGMEKNIRFLGRVKFSEVKELLETHNIGVSYIPINDYYDNQPPTKTFEYIMNGLVCLATNTIENKKVINERNGILVDDDINSLINGFEKVYKNINNYSKEEIILTLREYSWEYIVNSILKNIIENSNNIRR